MCRLARKVANSGAPGRTRTCDPRLRRPVARFRSAFLSSHLRRYPRDLPTRNRRTFTPKELVDGTPPVDGVNRIHGRQRLGGLLNYYARAA
jgi:hypothetical protein